MEQRNSYFQMDLRADGAYIKIFPPRERGQFIRVNEMASYLNNRGCTSFDIADLNRAAFMNKETMLRVGDSDGIAIDEIMTMDISPDRMRVTCRFFPPSEGGKRMTAEEIVQDIQYQGIEVGIDQEKIAGFVEAPMYCTDYIMARGEPPVHGKDAKIIYHFSTDVNLKPKRNEDGSVDYHELGTISHVEAGQVLASMEPAEPGESGRDVFGNEIKPPPVKPQKFSYANNITLSEDGTKIFSDVTGHVSLVNGKVFVSDVYEVPADVDNSIGNIDYQGNVLVRGNVKGGFTVVAKGDIVVEGVVEDAILHAGGQIVVKRGIHGMTKGVLRAKGDVICKFIESATVIAGGYIETDSVLHSQVSASTEIRVSGKKGFITGGVIRAGCLVEAKTIGSQMGAATRIEVGMAPENKERYNEVQKNLTQVNKDVEQTKGILANYKKKIAAGEKLSADKLQYVQRLIMELKEKQNEQAMLKDEYERLHMIISQSSDARVKVRRTIYPGVTVGISDISLTMKTERSFCQLLKRQGDIVIETL
jgi:hypothetical protein